MTAAEAAVRILELEGATQAFGVPGAAINPFYAALRGRAADGAGLAHVLARHVEGAAHMAEGYTRSGPGTIGVCVGTSGPAGTDMITGLYSAAEAAQVPGAFAQAFHLMRSGRPGPVLIDPPIDVQQTEIEDLATAPEHAPTAIAHG